MKEKNSKKECWAYEKNWGNFCVDKNLDDAWLERLNKLKAFRLVGICEGHQNRRTGSTSRYPNVNLKLRDEFIDPVVRRWPDLKTEMLKEAREIFENNEIKTRIEMSHKLRTRKGKIISQDEMKIRMMSNISREEDEMGEEIRTWFSDCVNRIEEIDRIVYSWYKRIGT